MPTPTEHDARSAAIAFAGEQVVSCSRFTTGLAHWVYDVVLESGRRIVIRMASDANRSLLAGAVYWHPLIARVGLPVPRLLAIDLDAELPFVVLERLPGSDLGAVMEHLTAAERSAISRQVVEMQHQVAQLSPASGFGYALSYDTNLHDRWSDVLTAAVDRSQRRIASAGVVDVEWGHRVVARLAAHMETDSFADIEPTAFLHDATTKNVIVDQGRCTGIVDIDDMAFGDPLWTAALTRMSLLSSGSPTDYIQPQLEAFDPYARQRQRFDLYTAVHGLGFLAELGHRFNREATAVNPALVHHLESVLARLLG